MSVQSDIAELRMVALNISATQQQYSKRLEDYMSQQLDAITSNLAILGTKIESFVSANSGKDATISALQAQVADLTSKLSATQTATGTADSPEAIQAVADKVAALTEKVPG